MEKELEFLDRFLGELEEDCGFFAEELEYGPGLSVSYFQGQENRTLEDLRMLSQAIGRCSGRAGQSWKWEGPLPHPAEPILQSRRI